MVILPRINMMQHGQLPNIKKPRCFGVSLGVIDSGLVVVPMESAICDGSAYLI